MTLRSRLLLAFFGLAIVPIAVVGVAIVVTGRRFAIQHVERNLERYLDDYARQVQNDIDQWRFSTDELLAEIDAAYTAGADEGHRHESCRNRIDSAFRGETNMVRMVFLNPEAPNALLRERTPGGGSRDSEIPFQDLERSIREMLDGARDSTDPNGRIYTQIRSVGAIVAFVTSISMPDRSWQPLLLQERSATLLLERIREPPRLGRLESSFAAARCAGHDGWSVIYASDPTRLGQACEVSASQESDESWNFTRIGDRVLGTGIHPDTGWILGGSISVTPIFAPLRTVVQISILLIVIMALLVITGILHVTRGIGRTVNQIEAATAAYARGDFKTSLEMVRNDEFGRIADGIQRMSRELIASAEARALARLSSRLIHDLKGILSQINLLLFNLRENPDDEEFRAEAFDLMEGLVQNVDAIVRKLRRIGEEIPPDPEPFELEALVRDLVDRPTLLSRFDVAFTLDPTKTPPIFTSRDVLAEAIDNVTGQALESLGNAKSLRIVTGEMAAPGPTHFVEIAFHGRQGEPGVHRGGTPPKGGESGDESVLDVYAIRQMLQRIRGRFERRTGKDGETIFRIEVGDRTQ